MPDLSATDRCVKCGLCLPHCPTFALTGNEADSPRGRISLMQMIAAPDPQWSPGLFVHLDRCLQCRACEAMCPSKVPYGALMDNARAIIETRRRTSAWQRWLRDTGLGLASSPRKLRWLGALLRIYRWSRMQALVSKLPGLPPPLRRANSLLPPPASAVTRSPRSTTARVGTVSLFRGCAGRLFDQHTLDAAREILQQLGYQVLVPDQQTCCGALHRHSGDTGSATRLMQTNLQAFDADYPIIGTASGCTAQLAEYGPGADPVATQTFARQVTDILHFLLQQELHTLNFAPLAEKVAVYIPCTHRNVLNQGQDLVDSLQLIPDIEPLVINPQGGCCGAAGSYMLSQPEFSDRLRTPVIDTIATSGAQRVVTSNIGCALQLQAGLKERGLKLEIVHPVVLLARCIR